MRGKSVKQKYLPSRELLGFLEGCRLMVNAQSKRRKPETWTLLSTVVLLLFLLSVSPGSYGGGAQPQTATPIDHVVVIMQENHTFDNYFGTYPTANGTITDGITSQLQPVNGIPAHVCLPLGESCISPSRSDSTNSTSPDEGQVNYESDYANRTSSGFPRYSGRQSMIYFDYHQIPAYWDYAEEYGLADNYFASALSTTTPNRLMLLAGDTPVSFNYGPPPYIPYDRTLLGQLTAAGISWGYFDFLPSTGGSGNVYPLNYISGLGSEAGSSIQNVSQFLDDLSRGSGLPAVSFVTSVKAHLDEHPPFNIRSGEAWVASVVNAVMGSRYWSSSVVFLTWDEGGGYYDHVVPPDVFTLSLGLRSALHGYGQRVPLIVISPFSKENYVSETLLNHMSLTKFVEYNWNLQPLTKNVADSNNLLDFFDFQAVPRKPIVLNSSEEAFGTAYPAPLQIPISQLAYSRSGSWNTAVHQTPAYIAAWVIAAATAAVVIVFTASRRRRFRFHSILGIRNSRWRTLESFKIAEKRGQHL